jgi:hypothetical protein
MRDDADRGKHEGVGGLLASLYLRSCSFETNSRCTESWQRAVAMYVCAGNTEADTSDHVHARFCKVPPDVTNEAFDVLALSTQGSRGLPP